MRALPILLLLAAACPETPGVRPDASPPDGLPLSEAGLAICRVPGEICIPADPCGLNPRCGSDLLCRVESQRSCDDGVVCTVDRCLLGGCEHTIASGSCLIEDRCFPAGAEEGCGRCDPALSSLAWTPLSGKSCDDRNLCTSSDQCQHGTCVGHTYSCNEGLPCTVDLCDGKGGCQHSLKEGACLIEQTCYAAAQTDPTGCLTCDPSITTSKWTARTMICTIDGACHGAGATDPTGCYACDPVHAPSSWTPIDDVCLIGGRCTGAGSVHLSGCAVCDPAKDPGYWSPLAAGALSWSSFDTGLGGWSLTPPTAGVGWGVSSARAQSAPNSLYYGNPASKSYRTGSAPNSGTVTAPSLTLPSQQKAFLGLQLFLDVENANAFDVLTVLVNGKPQWMKASTTVAPGDYRRWLPVLLDLSAFAGQSITVSVTFETKDGLGNTGEGVYLDDLTVFMGCGSIF
jgi:hypothetical protein